MAHYRQRSWAQTVNPSGGGGSTPTFGTVQWTPGSDGGLKPAIAVQTSFTNLALNRNQSIGVQTLMPSLALANNRSIAVQTTGSVLGAPFFQTVGSVESTVSGLTVVIPKPSGLAVGDLMVAAISYSITYISLTPPTGWTLILRASQVGVLNAELTTFWKIADSSDVAASNFTFTYVSASASGFFGAILRLNGTHATTPINASAAGTASAVDPIAPSVTTTVVNCIILVLCVQTQALDQSYTPPANYTERFDLSGFGLLGAHQNDGSGATRVQAAIAASAAQTFDSTAILAADYATQTIAIAPGEIFF